MLVLAEATCTLKRLLLAWPNFRVLTALYTLLFDLLIIIVYRQQGSNLQPPDHESYMLP